MGLINSNMPQPEQGQPEQQGQQPPDINVDETTQEISQALHVTPQMQQIYERIVTAAMAIIYDQSSHDGVMQMLKQGQGQGDFAPALAKTAVTIMTTLIGRMDKNAMPAPEVIVAAGVEIIVLLAELSTKSGVRPTDAPTIARAMQMALTSIAPTLNLPPEKVQQWMQLADPKRMQALVAAHVKQQGAQPPQQPQQPQPAQGTPPQPDEAP